MKALTVQQPWAWAIIHGGKSGENRTQAWSYRGPLAIHAGSRWSDRGATSDLIIKAAVKASPGDAYMVERWGVDERFEGYPRGAIIGVVDLVDVHQAIGDDLAVCCSSPWGETSYDEHGGRTRRELVHLELANRRPLAEPIPCRGALGLWMPPGDVLDQVLVQLVEATA